MMIAPMALDQAASCSGGAISGGGAAHARGVNLPHVCHHLLRKLLDLRLQHIAAPADPPPAPYGQTLVEE